MSWSEIQPFAKMAASQKPGIGITMAVNEGDARFRRRIGIVIRPALLEGMSFVRVGSKVKVLRGYGEHAKQIRITPGGPFVTSGTGGAKSQPVLFIPPFDGMESGAFPATAVEYDYGGQGDGQWIEITLPGWAQPALPLVAPPQPPVPVTKPPGASFKGHLASQPHVVLGDRRLAP